MSPILLPGPGAPTLIGESSLEEVPIPEQFMPRVRHGWDLPRPPDVPVELNTRSPLYEGLVAYWPMIVSKGTFPLRDLKSGYHMTPVNSPVWVRDRWVGAATQFVRASEQYLINNNAIVSGPPFTLACRFNSSNDANAQTLMAVCDKDAAFDHFYLIYAGGNIGGDPMRFGVNDGTGEEYADTTSGYSTGTFHYVSAVAAAPNDRRILIDGGSKGTNTASRSPANIDNVAIGAWLTNGSSVLNALDGLIAEAGIWNVAHDDAMVRYAYEHPWDLLRPVTRWWQGYSEPEEDTTEIERFGTIETVGWRQSRPPDVPFELNTASPQAKGLIGLWSAFDRANYPRDHAGHGLEMTTSTLLVEPSPAGIAYNATEKYASTPNRAIIQDLALGRFSLSYWIYFTAIQLTQNVRIMAKGGWTMGGWITWIYANGTGTAWLAGFMLDYDTTDFSASTPMGTVVAPNKLLNVVWTWDYSALTARCFVNGAEQSLNTNGPSGSYQTDALRALTIQVGSAGFYTGWGIEYRLYDRVLSQDEAQQIYDPATRYDIYRPAKRSWRGWAEPDVAVPAEGPYLLTGGWKEPRPPDVPFELNTESPLAKGLVAWWPGLMSRGSWPLRDALGRFPLTPVNGPTWTIGAHGPAPLFNGASTQYARIDLPAAISYPITMACWFNSSSDSAMQTLMWLGDKDSTRHFIALWLRGDESGDPLRAFTADYVSGVTGSADPTVGYTAGVLQHGCGVWENNSFRRAYINGGHEGTNSDVSGPMAQHDATCIGYSYDSTPLAPMYGQIADAAIWHRAFSKTEVQYLYDHPWELYRPLRAPKMFGGWSNEAIEEQEGPRDVNYDTVYYPRGWRRNRPPDLEWEMNDRSPQSKGLVAWWPTLGKTEKTMRCPVTGRTLAPAGSPIVRVNNLIGAESYHATTADYYDISPTFAVSGEYSFVCWLRVDSADAYRGAVLGDLGGGDSINVSQGGTIYRGSGLTGISTNQSFVPMRHLAITFSLLEPADKAYVDGIYRAQVTTDTGRARDIFYVGHFWGGTLIGGIADVRVYDRVLSPAEAWQMYDPATRWDLYRPVLKLAGGVREIITLEEAAELGLIDFGGIFRGVRRGVGRGI